MAPRARLSRGDELTAYQVPSKARAAAFFFKQWGGRTPKGGGRDLAGRTWDEFPVERSGEVDSVG